jgi:hypothetical protein
MTAAGRRPGVGVTGCRPQIPASSAIRFGDYSSPATWLRVQARNLGGCFQKSWFGRRMSYAGGSGPERWFPIQRALGLVLWCFSSVGRIWKQRNSRTFGGACTSPTDLLRQLLEEAHEWSSAGFRKIRSLLVLL